MKQPALMIIRGLPGSGKSTFAENLAENFNVSHFENDQFLMQNGKYVWTPDGVKKAAQQCFDSVMNELKQGKDCIVSNVFVTKKSVDRYADAAKRFGARVMVVRMTADFGNIHNVPKPVLASMKEGFEDYPGEQIRR